MGGIQYPHLNDITRDLWKWCEDRKLWVFASYINTKENVEADSESRKINIEWELSQKAFQKITSCFGTPEVDLFASRINNKCRNFVSWKRDPEAMAIDAFTLNWKNFFFLCFSAFFISAKMFIQITAR